MSKHKQALQLLQEDRDAKQGRIHNLEKRVKKLERELQTPRQYDSKLADQGRIINKLTEEIRQLKSANHRQAASLRKAKEALL